MYGDWPDLALDPLPNNVLHSFPDTIAREVAAKIVTELAGGRADVTSPDSAVIWSRMQTDADVQWCMECVCHTLSLPFDAESYPSIRDAVRIYCDWLGGIMDHSGQVPRPLTRKAPFYIDIMLGHLQHLFLIRKSSDGVSPTSGASDQENQLFIRQAKECHAVLRCAERLASSCPPDLRSYLAPRLLRFALAINDSVLALPYAQDDLSEQLGWRMLSSLWALWTWAASIGQFPSPTYWRSLHNNAAGWKHRSAFSTTWLSFVYALTHKLLRGFCRPDYPCPTGPDSLHKTSDMDKIIPFPLSDQAVLHLWFRILYLPPRPYVMLKLPSSGAGDSPQLDLAAVSYSLQKQYENYQHMHRGLNMLQDLFLGLPVSCLPEDMLSLHFDPGTPAPDRPNVDSLMSLFLDRALASVALSNPTIGIDRNRFPKFQEISLSAQTGRAHAMTLICKILAFARQGEPIRPEYLARFYLQLIQVLQETDLQIFKFIMPSLVAVVQQCFPGFVKVFPALLKALTTLGTEISAGQQDTDRSVWLILVISSFPYANTLASEEYFDGLRNLLFAYLHHFDLPVSHAMLAVGALVRSSFDQLSTSLKGGTEPQFLAEIYKMVSELLEGLLGRWLKANAVCLAIIDALNSVCHMTCQLAGRGLNTRPLVNLILKHLCYLVEVDLAKPPMSHSRELHSVICHAYMCLTRWVLADPGVTSDRVILQKLLSVVEMGVYGVRGSGGLAEDESPTSPRSVGPKPASRRVRDAADQLLIAIFARPIDNQSAWIDEFGEDGRPLSQKDATFFLLDGSVLYSLEQTADNSAEVTVWSGAGKNTWKLALDLKPTTPLSPEALGSPKSAAAKIPPKQVRPVPPNFPAEVDKFPTCKADYSVPPLKLSPAAQKLREIFKESIKEQAWVNARREAFHSVAMRPPEPVRKIDILRLFLSNFMGSGDKTFARLTFLNEKSANFLPALKRLNCSPVKIPVVSHIFYVKQGQTELTEIASNADDLVKNTCGSFMQFLAHLGPIPESSGLAREFSDKDEVAVRQNGNLEITTSETSSIERNKAKSSRNTESLPRFLTWPEWLLDLKFILPNPDQVTLKVPTLSTSSSGSLLNVPHSLSGSGLSRDRTQSSPKDEPLSAASSSLPTSPPELEVPSAPAPVPPPRMRSLTQDTLISAGGSGSASEVIRRKTTINLSGSQTSAGFRAPMEPRHVILVVWLEVFEEHINFPAHEAAVALLESSGLGVGGPAGGSEKARLSSSSLVLDDSLVHVIFMSPLTPHLLRVKLARYPSPKTGEPECAPLVSSHGAVVSLHTACHLVRESVASVGWRKRLDTESYLLPHVRRKQLIGDLSSFGVSRSVRDQLYRLIIPEKKH